MFINKSRRSIKSYDLYFANICITIILTKSTTSFGLILNQISLNIFLNSFKNMIKKTASYLENIRFFKTKKCKFYAVQ